MAGRKLRTWVICILAALGCWSLAVVVSSVNQGTDHGHTEHRGGKTHGAHGAHAHQAADQDIEEVPLGVAVKQLKGKIHQLRKPVDALLHRLEEVSVDSKTKAKQKNLPQNFHLVWHGNAPREQRIFVGLTSYDGLECRETVKSLFAQAARPELVFVAITQVHAEGSPSCDEPEYKLCNTSDFCPTDNIRRRSIHPKNYMGLSHAHHLQSLLFHGEEYVMFLSPQRHRFTQHWDLVAVEEYLLASHLGAVASTPTVKTVLTGIPVHGPATGQNFSDVPVGKNCHATLVKGGLVNVPQAEGKALPGFEWVSSQVSLGGSPAVGDKPRATPFASYQFLFGHRSLLTDTPPDPFLKYLSADEEDMLLSVKLYTHGYGFYVPRRSSTWIVEGALPQDWDKAKSFFALQGSEHDDRANALIRAGITVGQINQLHVKKIPAGHPSLQQRAEFDGVGKLRSAGQFFAAVGIDIHKQVVKDVCV